MYDDNTITNLNSENKHILNMLKNLLTKDEPTLRKFCFGCNINMTNNLTYFTIVHLKLCKNC